MVTVDKKIIVHKGQDPGDEKVGFISEKLACIHDS
jgi:hypothetical protein